MAARGDDKAYAVALSGGNELYLAGYTASGNFPVATALQNYLTGPYDGFVLQASYASAAAISVTPNSGSGLTQSFTLQYSDSAGATSLGTVWAAFSSTTTNPAPSSCAVSYSQATNSVSLENDAATASSGAVLGSTGTLANSQCSVNMAGTTVTLNGNALTFTLALTFNSSFSGSKNIYLWAADAGGTNSGWLLRAPGPSRHRPPLHRRLLPPPVPAPFR